MIQAMIFDLDGTLIDSRADLCAAINRMRHDYGLSPLDLDTVSSFIGNGARKGMADVVALAESIGAPTLARRQHVGIAGRAVSLDLKRPVLEAVLLAHFQQVFEPATTVLHDLQLFVREL